MGLLPALQEAPRWRERTGTVLVSEHGTLFRERDGAREELGCTAPGGTGAVLDVALDPAGLSFVAAENGLFVLGARVDVLDPVQPLEDAPSGTVRSVHVDGARRLWIATDTGIGALDPSFYFGRSLAPAELPGPGPYRVGPAEGGGVRLVGADSERVREPSRAVQPRVTALRVDGAELAPEDELRREPAGTLALEPTGTADGGTTFRYRFDRHHVWRALAPGVTVPMPSPGRHRLEVIALDQDLDRSEPFSVRVNVALPPHLDAGVLLAAALVTAGATLAFFLWHQRSARARLRPWRALVSTALVLVLALQVYAGIVPHGRGWPFMGFNMYTRAYARDEIIYDEQLVVLDANENELAVPPQSAGFMVDEPWEVLLPLVNDGEPALRAFLDAWRKRFPSGDARGLEVQVRRTRLTEHGPVVIAPLVLARYREADR
jgi:hypothetical protein